MCVDATRRFKKVSRLNSLFVDTAVPFRRKPLMVCFHITHGWREAVSLIETEL